MAQTTTAQTHRYPAGTVRALLGTPAVTPATRAALRARLAGEGAPAPRFFDAGAYAVLRAACARLVPQPDREAPNGDPPNGDPPNGEPPVDVAAMVDARLADGTGNGWRYDVLPPDPDAYRGALAALDADAERAHARPFAALGAAEQDALLRAVQAGTTTGAAWAALPPARFFEELLAEVTECYYSHPLAQEEIGYAGMADAPGWTEIGLDVLAAREPRPLGPAPAPPAPAIPTRDPRGPSHA